MSTKKDSFIPDYVLAKLIFPKSSAVIAYKYLRFPSFGGDFWQVLGQYKWLTDTIMPYSCGETNTYEAPFTNTVYL